MVGLSVLGINGIAAGEMVQCVEDEDVSACDLYLACIEK